MLEDDLIESFDEEQLNLWEQLEELRANHPDYDCYYYNNKAA